MTSKLNPFKKSNSDTNNTSSSDANSHTQPHSIGSDGTSSSNFKALLQQFGGKVDTSSLQQQEQEQPQPQKQQGQQVVSQGKIPSYRPFAASIGSAGSLSVPSAGVRDAAKSIGTSNATASDNNSSQIRRPLPLNRTKSAPASPEKKSNATLRAMSPPIRPPVHPHSVHINNVYGNNKSSSNNCSKAVFGNRSRTSSYDSSKSTTVKSIKSNNSDNIGGVDSTGTASIKLSYKSQMRIVFEQVASRYFLPENDKREVYVGVEDYGLDRPPWQNGADTKREHEEEEEFIGNVNGSILGLDAGGEGQALIAFLGVEVEDDAKEVGEEDEDASAEGGDDAEDGGGVADSEGTSENMVDLTKQDTNSDGSQSHVASPAYTTAEKKTPITAKQQAIDASSSIDSILEQASEQLSLGKNSLALQSYRRAMKVAYANVIEVKQKLMDIKREQIKLQYEKNDAQDAGLDEYVEDNEIDLTKQQEREFELLLLQVASRVADIHNNMGVVHEMDRHFQKAQSSYRDALDVYHNTCRRFEQTGDKDVDRTHQNLDRMALACNSERERKDLHAQASRIAKRVDQEKSYAARLNLLKDAVSTLERALDVETRTIGGTHPVAASTLIQMGKYHYEMREFDSSVMEIRQAIVILREALGPKHPQVGKAILLLASVYERQGLNVSPQGKNKDDATLELYVDALDPLKANLSDVHPEVGLLYIKIGYLYGKKGDRNLSALAYKAALKAYGEPWSCASGKVHPEVVSAWVRLTEHLMALKCWQEVVVSGQRALFLLRRARNTLYQDAHMRTSLVDTGPQPSSKRTKISPIQITSSTYYEALYTTLQCLGQAHTSLSQYPLAKLACKESLQLAWEIALANNVDSENPLKPENQAIVTSVLQIIRALKRLGKVYLLQKHYSDSLDCFLPALQLLRSSTEMESTLDAASVLGSLGFLYLKMERFTEASNFFRECLRLYQQNGVDQDDRETRKIQTWLAMAEAMEAESASSPPAFLEIPTIVYNDVGQYEL
ncbi:hypothetical protein HJC23_006655 [Cyclotella cryptica]|uniref:Kinesin light chain n=1 Tax=Cyclotella cryptica TaxID=29204 RepID=A0ABD3QXA7_9STRA|eukprot:CCRYP_001084-RB/>CCRYP_001084-RB protein AED:0.07 eAED:0.07 QI:242/1/1/1/0.5/0.33/3/522/1008